MRFKGKHDLSLRIVTIYRPVISTGATSAYKQQQSYLLSKDIDLCPRSVLLQDLHDNIDLWKQEGDQILIVGDFNEFVNGRVLHQFFRNVGMTEVFDKKHGNAPNTFVEGRLPIDGAFATCTLAITHCGYSAVDWGTPSDHHMLWLDLNLQRTLGTELPRIWTPTARRLKLIDPRVVARFLASRKKHDEDHKVLERLQVVHQAFKTNTATGHHYQELEELDRIRCHNILEAEENCRSLPMGNIAWSPDYQIEAAKIKYLQSCCRLYNPAIKKPRINSRTLLKQRKKARIKQPITNYEEAHLLIIETYKRFNKIKAHDSTYRLTYLQDLAATIAETTGGNSTSIYDQMIVREKQKELSRKLKLIKGLTKATLNRVEIPDGQSWKEVCGKEEVEAGCMQENIRRFTQANHTPSLLPESVALLGWTADTVYSDQLLRNQADLHLLHPSLQRLTPYLCTPNAISEAGTISMSISPEEYIYSWQ
jgi:hypothetical protein